MENYCMDRREGVTRLFDKRTQMIQYFGRIVRPHDKNIVPEFLSLDELSNMINPISALKNALALKALNGKHPEHEKNTYLHNQLSKLIDSYIRRWQITIMSAMKSYPEDDSTDKVILNGHFNDELKVLGIINEGVGKYMEDGCTLTFVSLPLIRMVIGVRPSSSYVEDVLRELGVLGSDEEVNDLRLLPSNYENTGGILLAPSYDVKKDRAVGLSTYFDDVYINAYLDSPNIDACLNLDAFRRTVILNDTMRNYIDRHP